MLCADATAKKIVESLNTELHVFENVGSGNTVVVVVLDNSVVLYNSLTATFYQD